MVFTIYMEEFSYLVVICSLVWICFWREFLSEGQTVQEGGEGEVGAEMKRFMFGVGNASTRRTAHITTISS